MFVDANGAYGVRQAQHFAARFAAEQDVRWFEEPVSSDDLDGLRRSARTAPATMEIAAGEYGYTLDYFRQMLGAGAVDVQQADATRCGGVTGFLQAATLCEAWHTDLSAHCAPALHRHLGCAAPRFRHVEWFHDHVRIEHMLFDGAPGPEERHHRAGFRRPGTGPYAEAAGRRAVRRQRRSRPVNDRAPHRSVLTGRCDLGGPAALATLGLAAVPLLILLRAARSSGR